MTMTVSAPSSAHGVRAAAAETVVPAPAGVEWASAWLDAALAWQTASWTAHLEAVRLMQQALRPDTWTHVAEQWAYVLRNGPIPA